MSDLIREFWHVILGAITAVVFMVRMEGKTAHHALELDRLQRQRDSDQAAHQRSRDETHSMLRDMDVKLDRLIERNMR